MAKKTLPPKYQVWVNARKQFHLSHAQIQMAKELGMDPKKLGGKKLGGKKLGDKSKPNPKSSKLPLPAFIEQRYLKQFGKSQPDDVRSIEQIFQDKRQRRAERKAERLVEPDAADDTASS